MDANFLLSPVSLDDLIARFTDAANNVFTQRIKELQGNESAPQPEDEKPYSRDKAAEYLGITKATLDNWVRAGKLKAYRGTGRRIYFHLGDLKNTLTEIRPASA